MAFFDTVRARPFRRTEDRILGGVCAGLAHRWGIAPILVRLLFMLVSLVGGLPLILYGIGWLLIPEYRDGRIHLQELFSGRPDVALAAAVGLIIVGAIRPVTWYTSTMESVGALLPIVMTIAAIAAIPLALVIVFRALSQRGREKSPDPLEPSEPSPLPPQPPVAAVPARAPRPRKPKSPAIPGKFAMGIIALAVALGALSLLFQSRTLGSWLVAAGVSLAVIAAGLVIAAATQRRGTWLTAASWLLAPVVTIGVGLGIITPTVVLSSPNATLVQERIPDTGTLGVALFADAWINPGGQDVNAAAAFGGYRYVDDASEPVIIELHSTGISWLTFGGYGGWELEYPNGSRSMVNPELFREDTGDIHVFSTQVSTVVAAGETAYLRNVAALANPAAARRITLSLGSGNVFVDQYAHDAVSFVTDKLGVTPPPTEERPEDDQ